MKRIINGRRYDTDTATMVGEYQYSGPSDFNYFREELYRKKTGEFFVYGEGGPMSQYAVSESYSSWSGGSKITPISFQEAQKWAEDHLTGDEYESIFGAVDEGGEKQTVAIRLTPAAVAKLKNVATQQGITQSDIIENLIKSL